MSQAAKKSTGHKFYRSTGQPVVPKTGTVRIPRQFGSATAYSVKSEGGCMTPLICDGDEIVCDPQRTPKNFDIVAIYLRADLVWVKRLRHDWEPGRDLVCEQHAEDRMYRIPADKVQRVHVVTYNVTQRKGLLDLPYDKEFISFPILSARDSLRRKRA